MTDLDPFDIFHNKEILQSLNFVVICSDLFFQALLKKKKIRMNDLLEEANLIISFETDAHNFDPFRVKYIIFRQCLIASVQYQCGSNVSNANVVPI